MRRGATISALIHATIIIAAIVALPMQPLNTSADQDVDVDLVGPQVPQHSDLTGKTPANMKLDQVHQGPIATNQPKPQPLVAPPPPPPPPPPAPDAKPTPTPPAPAAPPPPPTQTPIPTPMPPPPPQPPQKRTSVTPPKKAKPVKQPPAPMKSPMHQQHEVKTPAPLSPSVLNTLLKLQALQKQDKPPTAHYNPDAGGAPDAGGSPNSTANSGLSEADRNAIGAWVRRCWTIDAGAQNVQNYAVLLLVTTDPTGTVRMAQVSPQNNGGDMSDPEYFAFTQRAIAAVEDYQCATLPLPSNMLGQNQTFLFNFTP
ncbi:hypothetical protein [Acidocella sp.]|uniref:hypothetical protein n=1 Tax=Acidocella sp. TaxID=50710 RepID=UPI002627541C|nr:hypothetical protein [Acidocella sp.]